MHSIVIHRLAPDRFVYLKSCFLAVMLFGASSAVHAADSAGDDLPVICSNLVAATPDADVAYQAGVDVHGKPVAPADLPGNVSADLGKNVTFPLTVNLAKSIGLNTAAYPYNQLGTGTEGVIGTLSVRDNKAYLNGKPLSDPEQDRLAVLCMQPR